MTDQEGPGPRADLAGRAAQAERGASGAGGRRQEIRLAIVGTRVLACSGDRERAKARAAAAIRRLLPGIVISGGADGSDQLGAEAAAELGYSEEAGTLIIMRPRVRRLRGPGGFRERDEKIAQACTHLLRIFCQHATTYGSGWTADRAEQIGAVVVRYNACGDRNQPGRYERKALQMVEELAYAGPNERCWPSSKPKASSKRSRKSRSRPGPQPERR